MLALVRLRVLAVRREFDCKPPMLKHEGELPDPASHELTIDHQQIFNKANAIADLFLKARSEGHDPLELLLPYADDIGQVGLPSSKVRNVARWFRIKLLRSTRQTVDFAEHRKSLIGSSTTQIVSKAVLTSRRQQLAMQSKYIADTEILGVSEHGEEIRIPAAEVYKTPEKRFAKLYVHTSGLEHFCKEQGQVGFFLTLTLPPEYHSNPSVGKNTWSGYTPSDGHKELQRRWRLWQRRFGKTMFVRVEEQHKDGCAHWHALVFVAPSRQEELKAMIYRCFGPPPAATIVKLDAKRGGAATYLMKYLLKATGAQQPDHFRNDRKVIDVAELADAHRAVWGGRAVQIAALKGSATIWDEIRRVKWGSGQHKKLSTKALELHSAATTNNYGEFLTVLDDLNPAHGEQRCTVIYRKNDHGTILVRGLRIDGVPILTREKVWKVVRRRKHKA